MTNQSESAPEHNRANWDRGKFIHFVWCVCVWTYIQLWLDTENNQTAFWHQAVCVLLHVILFSNVFFLSSSSSEFSRLSIIISVFYSFLYQLIALFTLCAEKYKNIKVRAVIARKCNTQEAASDALPGGRRRGAAAETIFSVSSVKMEKPEKRNAYSEW